MSNIEEMSFNDNVSNKSGIDLANFPKLDNSLFSTVPIIAQNPKGSKADWMGLKKKLGITDIISLNDFRKGLRDADDCEISLTDWNDAKKLAKIDRPNVQFILSQSVNWLTVPNNPDVKIGVLKGEKYGTIYVINTAIATKMLKTSTPRRVAEDTK